jgi:ketosteroid isomerase-like protein
MSLRDELVTIERTLWTTNREIYDAHLEDDAVLVFPETGVMHRAAALAGIEQENLAGRRWVDVAFADVEAVAVTPDVALLTYRADARSEHESAIRSVLATSLYVRRDRGWMLAFHQQSYPEGVKALAALPSLPRDTGRHRFGAVAGRAAALGACAIGATALGAVAIGRLAVGAFAARRGRIRRLTIDHLNVGNLRVDSVFGDRVVRLS